MLPTIASQLASGASGAALPLASGLAAAAPPLPAPRGGLENVAAVIEIADAFLGAAKKAGPSSAAGGAPASGRARTADAGYAAAAKPAPGTAAAKKTTAAKASSSAAKASSAAAKKAGPLAFLDDKNLSVEEKLMRLLAHLSAKWDKDLEKKLKEFQTGQQQPAAAAQAAPKKKSGGLLGSIGSVVGAATKFFPAVGVALEALKNPAVRAVVSKIGGPVLAAAATALGYPALAPLLLKYGPAVVNLAAGVASSLDGATAGSGGTSASTSSTATGAGASPSETGMNDREMQLKLMEIQRIRDLQKEMFSMVSHILRSGHETRMNVIQNIR
jgi:hypothetical protein